MRTHFSSTYTLIVTIAVAVGLVAAAAWEWVF